jgi:hypothetical protein
MCLTELKQTQDSILWVKLDGSDGCSSSLRIVLSKKVQIYIFSVFPALYRKLWDGELKESKNI